MQSQNISALGHNEVIDETIEPTCTKTGLTEGKHCSLCGEVLVAQEEIPALGHTFENGKCIDCKEEDPDFVSLTLTSSTYNINLTDYSYVAYITMIGGETIVYEI